MTARLFATLIATMALSACATARPLSVTTPVTYTGSPQEQWEQGQAAFEAWSLARPGWKATETGLQYSRVKAAKTSAPMPAADAVVTIHYVGRFIDGREFDSSRARGEPATFPLPRLIKGWQEGVPLMCGRDLGIRDPGQHCLRLAVPRADPVQQHTAVRN